MVQCQCNVRDKGTGQMRLCSRNASPGSKFCSQHQLCSTPASSYHVTPPVPFSMTREQKPIPAPVIRPPSRIPQTPQPQPRRQQPPQRPQPRPPQLPQRQRPQPQPQKTLYAPCVQKPQRVQRKQQPLGHNFCDDLGGMKNDRNSCYLDSLLYVLLYREIDYITTNIIKKDVSQLIINELPITVLEDLYAVTIDIQNELHRIQQSIRDGQIFGCKALRDMFQAYQETYTGLGFKLKEKVNWITADNEPMDVINLLNTIFQLPINTTIKTTSIGALTPEEPIESMPERETHEPFTIMVPVPQETQINTLFALFSKTVTMYDAQNLYYGQFPVRIEEKELVATNFLHFHLNRLVLLGTKRTKLVNRISPDPRIKNLELTGIVVHKGGATGGHYVAFVKCHDMWYYYNDAGFAGLKRIGNFDTFQNTPQWDEILSNATDFFYCPVR
jgi:hypothetical protein